MGFLVLGLFLLIPVRAVAIGPSALGGDLAQVTAAFFTSLAVHEAGHALIADQMGGEEVSIHFFTQENDNFALGLTKVKKLDRRSTLPFAMGGEIANSLNFEYALHSYRRQPTIYNRSLLLFSGTDFLWYTVYSFYISGGASYSDPLIIQQETGLSREAILGVALTQSLLNFYRITSGKDTIVPYFTYDRYSVNFMLRLAAW
jgi:hypothetical protein